MGYNINDDQCNSTCTFDIVNGVALSGIGVGGVLLNVLVICISHNVHLPGKQRYFIVNLAVADVLLSLAATQRGLGLLSTELLIGGPRTSWFCTAYAISLNFVGYINSWALVPITIERFVAIVIPFKLQNVLSKRNCIVLCMVVWAPNLLCLLIETGSYFRGTAGSLKIEYNPLYGRCTYNNNLDLYVFVKGIICFLLPLGIICICYTVIFVIMARRGIRTKRILVISILIVGSGITAWAPTVIVHYGNLNISKPVSHIFTITLFYSIGFLDPLIYILGYKNITAFLRGRQYYREHRRSQIEGHADIKELREEEYQRSCRCRSGSLGATLGPRKVKSVRGVTPSGVMGYFNRVNRVEVMKKRDSVS